MNQKTGKTAVLASPMRETKHQMNKVKETPGWFSSCQIDMGGSTGPLLSFADTRVCKIDTSVDATTPVAKTHLFEIDG